MIALDIEDPIVDDLAFTFPKDTEFRNIFNYYLNKLKESGSVRSFYFFFFGKKKHVPPFLSAGELERA